MKYKLIYLQKMNDKLKSNEYNHISISNKTEMKYINTILNENYY